MSSDFVGDAGLVGYLVLLSKDVTTEIVGYLVLLLLVVTQCNKYNQNKIGFCLGLAWLAFIIGFWNVPLRNTEFLSSAWLVGYKMSW